MMDTIALKDRFVSISQGYPGQSKHPLNLLNGVDVSTTSGSAAVFTFLPEEPTTTHYFDLEMLQLERAVKLDDEVEFVRIVNQMDWSSRSVDNYLRAISLALQIGAHLIARKLAQEGTVRFPDHPDMSKHARILSPVVTLRTGLPPEPRIVANMNWLKEHRNEYKGLWVAIENGEMVASASNPQALIKIVGNVKNTDILITRA
jgi:hypothetical protein